VYKRGNQLKYGLLDVNGICSSMNFNEKQPEGKKWKDALKAMRKNPELMFQAMPSVWDQP
jgi:hypothetical protein